MTSSVNKYDTLEHIIFEQGLRIVGVHAYQKLDLLLFVLNTGRVLQYKISTSPRLTKASQEGLNGHELIAGGVGVHWPEVDEDLSLKGLLKESLKSEYATPAWAMAA